MMAKAFAVNVLFKKCQILRFARRRETPIDLIKFALIVHADRKPATNLITNLQLSLLGMSKGDVTRLDVNKYQKFIKCSSFTLLVFFYLINYSKETILVSDKCLDLLLLLLLLFIYHFYLSFFTHILHIR